MIPEWAVWLILFLPLGSFVLIGFVVRPFFNKYAEVAGYLTILAVGGSLALSAWALGSVIDNDGKIVWDAHPWITVGNLDIDIGILMDPLTAIMLIVATSVSLMVQVYSTGYMRDRDGKIDGKIGGISMDIHRYL